MKAIIYGVAGQDGFYLRELCESAGVEVIGLSRSGIGGSKGDVSHQLEVVETISRHKPDYVFHLAANSTVRHDALFENHATLTTGTLNILEACRSSCPEARVFIAGSGLQFKNVGKPISENDAFAATSAYCMSRISCAFAARYYRTLGSRVYVGYLFHHESPLRKPAHLSKMIASAAARISRGSSELLEIGNLDVVKEWAFARDIVEGIWALINQDEIFEAAIGSGKGYSIRTWAAECFSKVGLDALEYIRPRSSYVADFDRLVSDPMTMNGIGWKATTSMSTLASMMLDAELAAL